MKKRGEITVFLSLTLVCKIGRASCRERVFWVV